MNEAVNQEYYYNESKQSPNCHRQPFYYLKTFQEYVFQAASEWS